ncbi:hypothetical protein [uncultured Cohaesibacter sp.]|uniref:capsular polysaccharide export protein, LipB/KpsS family n=1 Tax=uncultured Cohaesibacter sp. TaxID=1002546 RepID=UPI0029C956D7|nr:hypothetical protein [uncultured Cohaesibacter sp.]
MDSFKKSIKRLAGYLHSVLQLRHTRLGVEDLGARLAKVEQQIRDTERQLQTNREMLEFCSLDLQNRMVSERAKVAFDPGKLFSDREDMAVVYSPTDDKDFDGGPNEHLKNLLKTPFISNSNFQSAELIALTKMTPDSPDFLGSLVRSKSNDIPLYFFQTTFFGAYASPFDKKSGYTEKKALGFIVDDLGFHFDSRLPSRLELSLNDKDLSLTAEQQSEARRLIDRLIRRRITKYNKYVSADAAPTDLPEGSVLVIDQNRQDASVRYCGAGPSAFDDMLKAAIAENPHKRVYVKAHPDNRRAAGEAFATKAGAELLPDNISVVDALEAASSVYTVSSQVGFEALLRGIHVVVWGQPFYAGWGLTDDRCPLPRRQATRTIEELFYIACIKHSIYIDPATGRHTVLNSTIDRFLDMRK